MKKTILIALTCAVLLGPNTFAATPVQGLTINAPIVGRLTGGGNTLYTTAIDVTNLTTRDLQIDYYFDGQDVVTGLSVTASGSVTSNGGLGLWSEFGSTVQAGSNVHLDDFIDALVRTGEISPQTALNGVLGSAMFVFGSANARGDGLVVARFYNPLANGTVGVALKGHELSTSETQVLTAAVRDTTARSGTSKTYPNLFINHTGVTTAGAATQTPVSVTISAAVNGRSVGNPVSLTIASGRTASLSNLFSALHIDTNVEDTVIVTARVTAGDGAIHGVVSQVDSGTKDGSAFEMVPGR